jgi:hypothetical protein
MFTDKNFRQLVEFFNNLERDLEYPKCDGFEDQKRVLMKAQRELTMWGKI